MEYIYIFGTSGFAREIYYLIKDTQKYIVKAFIDLSVNQKQSFIKVDESYIPIIEEDVFYKGCNQLDKPNASVAIANNAIVEKITKRFQDKCNFPNIIHPSFKQLGNTKMGIGNIITYNNFFSDNIQIGSFNRFNIGCILGHDVRIGDFNQVNPYCNISGNVNIGHSNFFGVKSTILQGINIGNYNTIGTSSLLIKSIKDNGTYIGSPARKFEY